MKYKKEEQIKEIIEELEKLLDRCEVHNTDKPCIQCSCNQENRDGIWFRKSYWNEAIRHAISFAKEKYAETTNSL